MSDNKKPIYLSVVMSTYNDEKFIGRAIQSILNQSYPYFEFIIVNDGSTDNTLNVIQGFQDNRIRIINKKNTGLPDSLNVGFENAKYEWIARMDSDDYAFPNRFQEQVKLIRGDVGVIGGQCTLIDENDQLIGESRMPVSSCSINLCMFYGSSPVFHPTAIIQKQAWKDVGGYDPFFSAGQDKDLWYKISAKYKIKNTPLAVLGLRKHSNNISINKRNKQYESGVISQIKHSLGIDRRLTYQEYEGLKGIIRKSRLCRLLYMINSKIPQSGLIRKLRFFENKLLRGVISIYYTIGRRYYRQHI